MIFPELTATDKVRIYTDGGQIGGQILTGTRMCWPEAALPTQ
ncbi:MAG: hypothetical protein ACLUUO_15195 [Sellimonas intestinalis]